MVERAQNQIRLWMPTPPSTNALFIQSTWGKNGRSPSREYEAWQKLAIPEIRLQKPIPMRGKVMLAFFIGERSVLADCSNYIKAAEDMLVSLGLIEGDSAKYVRAVSACWVPNYNGTVVHISPYVESEPPWIGFDAGVLGQVQPSPVGDFIKSNQTLGAIRRKATGEAWTSAEGETGRSRADQRRNEKLVAKRETRAAAKREGAPDTQKGS